MGDKTGNLQHAYIHVPEGAVDAWSKRAHETWRTNENWWKYRPLEDPNSIWPEVGCILSEVGRKPVHIRVFSWILRICVNVFLFLWGVTCRHGNFLNSTWRHGILMTWRELKILVWPLTPKIDRVTLPFSKFDIRHWAYWHATGPFLKFDMGQGHVLHSTCDMGIDKWQRHVTLAFLKIDRWHGDPPSMAPLVTCGIAFT